MDLPSEQLVPPTQAIEVQYRRLQRPATNPSQVHYVTPLPPHHSHLTEENIISLYDGSEDNVIELTDANFTSSIYNSEFLWIVEFYAHWCGHCQRFVPVWKETANIFQSK